MTICYASSVECSNDTTPVECECVSLPHTSTPFLVSPQNVRTFQKLQDINQSIKYRYMKDRHSPPRPVSSTLFSHRSGSRAFRREFDHAMVEYKRRNMLVFKIETFLLMFTFYTSRVRMSICHFYPWRWDRYAVSKHQAPNTLRRGVTSQKIKDGNIKVFWNTTPFQMLVTDVSGDLYNPSINI